VSAACSTSVASKGPYHVSSLPKDSTFAAFLETVCELVSVSQIVSATDAAFARGPGDAALAVTGMATSTPNVIHTAIQARRANMS
jgi:uncharacterized protein (UPF0264 family)